MWTRVVLWITLILLISIIIYEVYGGQISEGFGLDESSLKPVSSNFWARLVPRRSDVGPDNEVIGINRNKKYYMGYADVQRFSADTDFCRMVNLGTDPLGLFFACALGGTDNTSSISYKSPTVKQGFRLSRDDYMNDTNGDGRDDYCRILKMPNGLFETQCNPATDKGFELDMVVDPNPPLEIKKLLAMYDGIMAWLRFYDDTYDYAQNLTLRAGGGIKVDESEPNPKETKGLVFNGVNQYMRIGDDRKLAIGNKVLPRSLRAISFWVKFEEFTNNAHIFDFGNGAGVDNVWCGIQGRGNMILGAEGDGDFLTKICKGIGGGNETLPDSPSGQQPGLEVHPQTLMKTTCANVDEYECKGMALEVRPPPRPDLGGSMPGHAKPSSRENADMIYEIWEAKTRKLRIKVPNAFVKGLWTHVVITADKPDSFRPNLKVYINGVMRFVQPSGCLPAAGKLVNNFLGKSNWADATSQFANKDELFKGAIFDFRLYSTPMSDELIKNTVDWGRERLGMQPLLEKEED